MSDLISRQKAKDAIDIALDHIDHVPSWVYDNLLNALNEVPSVKPTHSTPSNTLNSLDCVDRQMAIDTVKFGITYAKAFNKSTGEVKELFKEGNKALNEAAERLKELPSAQPEIIRCKDCKWCSEHYDTDGNVPYWVCINWDAGTDADGFCHEAELRGDSE